MKNELFTVKLDPTTGCVQSIFLNGDENAMDWCREGSLWGEPVIPWRCDFNQHWIGNELLSFEESDTASVAVIRNGKLQITAERSFTERKTFRERYTFKNLEPCDQFLQRGEVGIRTPFFDEQMAAEKSQRLRCDAHVWCGEEISWVNALRQGDSTRNLGLVLTEGSLDCYSIEHPKPIPHEDRRNYRGDIILHPEAIDLLRGESYVVEWELFPHSGTEDFFEKARRIKKGFLDLRADFYTIFKGENFRFFFETDARNVGVTLDGEHVDAIRSGNRVEVTFTPKKWGEHKFFVTADGVTTHIALFAAKALDELIEERLRFIVRHQQYSRPESPLDGAYLIYDNTTKRYFFDDRLGDHNASNERLGMGITIARWLQKHPDPEIYESLMKYVAFIKREIVNMDTGEVFFSIGRDLRRIRLYNAPWMITFMTELYNLTHEGEYLDFVYRAVKVYYTQGGEHFYPNGFSIKFIVDTVRGAGRNEQADEIEKYFLIHAQNMLDTGLNYPPMECVFEQTIVTPAVAFICDMGMLTNDPTIPEKVQAHLKVLERFDGMQPDYRLNGIAIRHWDDYWFGKSMLRGDTLPHYWACLTARSWQDYAELSGDKSFLPRAQNAIRNCLCTFHEDNTASCAYMYPFSIDGVRGEFYDEWANDQDFALYFALQIL